MPEKRQKGGTTRLAMFNVVEEGARRVDALAALIHFPVCATPISGHTSRDRMSSSGMIGSPSLVRPRFFS